jgi:thiosulfate/3-mercaptopyruvate sulfurtransferase
MLWFLAACEPSADPVGASDDPAVDAGSDGPVISVLDPHQYATILDLRPDFSEGHVPGGVAFDPYAVWPVATDVDPAVEADRLRGDLAAMGLREPIAIVGDAGSPWGEDGWTWFLLRVAGYEQVVVLDGGSNAWTGPLETEPPPLLPPADPTPAARPELITTADEVARGDALVLDVRSPGEHAAGHIPGAISWDNADTVDPDGYLVPADELRASLAAVGFAEPAITSCQIGVRAGHALFVLSWLGYEPRSFPGSYAAWRDQGRPIEDGS